MQLTAVSVSAAPLLYSMTAATYGSGATAPAYSPLGYTAPQLAQAPQASLSGTGRRTSTYSRRADQTHAGYRPGYRTPAGYGLGSRSGHTALGLGYTAAAQHIGGPRRAPGTGGDAGDRSLLDGLGENDYFSGALAYEIDGVYYWNSAKLEELWEEYKLTHSDVPQDLTWEEILRLLQENTANGEGINRLPLPDGTAFLIALLAVYAAAAVHHKKRLQETTESPHSSPTLAQGLPKERQTEISTRTNA